LKAPGDRLELERDARQPLFDRVMELARDTRPLVQHRLVLLAFPFRERAHPERADDGRERQDCGHHRRVP